VLSGRRPLLFMSGGEDSRVLASLVREQVPADATVPARIFLDGRNREWRLADTAARLIGVELDVLLRAPDHYTAQMARAAAVTGSGYDLVHAHSIGLVDDTEADVFLDGYTADLFYKATFQSVAHRRIGSIPVSVGRPDHSRTSTVDPIWPSGDVGQEVARRRRDRRRLVGEVRLPRSIETWAQGWPIADRATFPFFLSNWRSRPTVSPFMLGNMLDLVAVVPEDAKIDRALFHRAFGPIMGRSGWVPRSGGQIPALAGRKALVPAATIRSAGLVTRRLRPARDGASDGPWQTNAMLDRAYAAAFAAVPDEVVTQVEAMVDRSSVTAEHPPSSAQASRERQRLLQLTALVWPQHGA
jgi:hypothetical protein